MRTGNFMHTLRSVEISRAEWRWVIIVSGLLVALTLLPYAWALASNQNTEDGHFMGILSNPKDGATYLSKIEQGRRGAWLFELRHTPEAHNGAGFHTFYIFLGHVAQVTGLSNVLIFHLARVATSLFMFIALYQFAATVWVRLRPRRLFFTLIAVGSGLGWLLILFGSDSIAADMKLPEAFPLFAAYTNPHFPLSIAALALIASTYIMVFRRGQRAEPSVDNGGMTIMLLSILLALIQPTALLPIGGALVVYVLVRYRITQAFPAHELRWSSMLWLPALPFAVYDVAVFRFNDIMGEFNRQNQPPAPAPYLYLFGYGLLLIVAIPGLIRAVRRFERDGDQLMLLWFAINVIGLYVPFNLQRRLALGLSIPLVYFAVRALEDYWFYKIPRDWRAPTLIAVIVFLVPSNILNLGIPLFGVVADEESGLNAGLLMESDYWNTLQWLDKQGTRNAVVLAAPTISLWIPAYTEDRVVYGHEFETVPNEERLAQVEDWYLGRDCTTLIGDNLPFHVRYILWGPREQAFIDDNGPSEGPPGKCIMAIPEDHIQQRVDQGEVTIYDLGPA